MRIQITSLIIFIAILNVAANVNGQNITIKAKNATLTSVFNEIKKQTGYGFFYEKKEISVNTKPSWCELFILILK